MFIVTQGIGLFIVHQYAPQQVMLENGTVQNVTPELPYGLQPPEVEPKTSFVSILIAFALAVGLLLLLSTLRAAWIIKAWFFFVVVLALGIAFNGIIRSLSTLSPLYIQVIAFLFALPLGFIKIYKRNIIVHNITELFIYPGIAVLFIPLLNLWTLILLLLAICIYDIYAVWHAGFMQKMAKYQIQHLRIFSGFFVPYIPKHLKTKIKLMKPQELKKKRIKVSIALLGGGDVVFPIITAGLIFNLWGLLPALFVTLGATLGLAYLLFFSEKGKFYPAMPFITAGMFVGMLLGYLLQIVGSVEKVLRVKVNLP